ncbi:MAG: TolC family protein [Alphaproteobacteria bacterium]|nr:TolC family protein [Alphaproteobacteria bacterium]MCL2758118.1 TolC family protein [Alphaproteobacteria bacterium]
MKKICSLFLVLFLCAQNADAMNLSLADATARIITESQDINKAVANIERARAGLSAVDANRRLNVSTSASYMNLINVERPGQAMEISIPPMPPLLSAPIFVPFPQHIGMVGVSATQPIYTFGKIGHAADAARTAIRMAESGHALAYAEVRAAAIQIYWTAKMTDEMVRIAEKNLRASTDAKRQLERAGRANRANLVQISADIAVKEIALSDAKFNRDSAHRLLKVMAGINSNERLVLTDEFPTNFTELNAPNVLSSNHEWDILEKQAQMYESQSRSRRAGRLPTIAATASYNWTMMHDQHTVWDGDRNQSANWGLAIAMPIFEGGLSRANATMDAMAAESARQDLDKSRRMRSNEYRDALLRHEHLRQNLAKLRNAHDLAERAASISADRFASGQTSAVELAEVQAGLAQMDMALVNAKFNIIMAEASVERLSGR